MCKIGNLVESGIQHIPRITVPAVGPILFECFQRFASQCLYAFINAVYLFLRIRSYLRLVTAGSAKFRTELIVILIAYVTDILKHEIHFMRMTL